MFSPLSKTAIIQVVKLEVEKLVSRIKRDKQIDLTYSDLFIYYVSKNAYSSEYGARPVARFLEEDIETKIAKLILQNLINTGSTYNLDQLVVTKENSMNE